MGVGDKVLVKILTRNELADESGKFTWVKGTVTNVDELPTVGYARPYMVKMRVEEVHQDGPNNHPVRLVREDLEDGWEEIWIKKYRTSNFKNGVYTCWYK